MWWVLRFSNSRRAFHYFRKRFLSSLFKAGNRDTRGQRAQHFSHPWVGPMDSVGTPGAEHVITRLLLDWRGGDLTAYEQLASLVYGELHRIARRQMSWERPEHTLQPSALVNEAFLRLIDYDQVNWQNRQHFFSLAAKMMREVLVNYASARNTRKRGGKTQRLTLDDAFVGDPTRTMALDELLELNEALEHLAREDERCAKVVELMFFAGLSEKETAHELHVSDRTVKREWRYARLWLKRELSTPDEFRS
jgi:RNA polymerase sigma factor (TIGR02999 family)